MQGARTGYLMVAVAATLFGINGSVSRLLIDAGIDSTHLTELRMTGAALLLAAWVLARDRGGLRMTRRQAIGLLVFGILGLALVQWLYFEALARIDVGLSLVIEFTAPLLVALWVTTVHRQRLPRGAWAAMLVALLGLALAVGLGSGGTVHLDRGGLLAAGAAAFAFAGYILLAEHHVEDRSPAAVLAIGMVAGALFWAVIQPWWSFPFAPLGHSVAISRAGLHVPVALLLAWMLVLGTVIPFALVVAGVARVGATPPRRRSPRWSSRSSQPPSPGPCSTSG
jgi:drug/metabolite transporter (DMT)-like permease